ncbi:lactate utilization protein [Campylobacter sp. FMV-PI01]|uniref:Lactate utilization protein n=1 Tax=Campylobacter portucalensis TaxID=2608384 RepID=A0A6L5WIN0_9BACT|nr:lactate utilization protein [Campylobacter portucalensis]MSN95673.1 lactate utilization protein [Campylobacter portucalensis]
MIEVMQNLKNNGFEVVLVEDKNEALEYAKKFIKADISIGLGGSTTVAEIGLLDYLTSLKNIILFNQYEKNISGAENLKRRRDGLLSDLYITGTNAITKNGEIVNVDGSGNRVAAQIFGPKKVLIFVSTDKIVNNLEEAMDRINKICIPKNIQRCNETALKYGKEPKFNERNIAKKFSIIKGDDEGRIIIVLIKQRLGF